MESFVQGEISKKAIEKTNGSSKGYHHSLEQAPGYPLKTTA